MNFVYKLREAVKNIIKNHNYIGPWAEIDRYINTLALNVGSCGLLIADADCLRSDWILSMDILLFVCMGEDIQQSNHQLFAPVHQNFVERKSFAATIHDSGRYGRESVACCGSKYLNQCTGACHWQRNISINCVAHSARRRFAYLSFSESSIIVAGWSPMACRACTKVSLQK